MKRQTETIALKPKGFSGSLTGIITNQMTSDERKTGEIISLNSVKVKKMNEITCAEVKQRIDSGDKIKLVFATKDWQFNAKRIPGSIKIRNEEDLRRAKFKIDDEIIVYSSNESCPGHKRAYKALRAIGYTNVKAFVGGLFEWESCGYKLNGGWVDNEAETST